MAPDGRCLWETALRAVSFAHPLRQHLAGPPVGRRIVRAAAGLELDDRPPPRLTAAGPWRSHLAGGWDAFAAAAATGAAVYVPLSALPGFVVPSESVGVEWLLTLVFGST